MINFQIKCAMANMWRELQKDVLEELSGLYSSVYSGDRLKNWPTIFILACILLAVWEEMQFDSHYRTPVSTPAITPVIIWKLMYFFFTRMRRLWTNSAPTWRPLQLALLLACSRPSRRSCPHFRTGRRRSTTTCSTRTLTCAALCPKSVNMWHNMVRTSERGYVQDGHWHTSQRATSVVVATRHLTVATLTAYPTNLFLDLLFARIKRQKRRESIYLQLDARIKFHYACYFSLLLLSMRYNGCKIWWHEQARYLYYYEHIWDMPTHFIIDDYETWHLPAT